MDTLSPAADLPALCHALMERSPVPMAELEGEAHIVRYANLAFCRLAGKPRQALVGRPFAETMQEGDTCLAALERVYRTGQAEVHTESGHPAYWSYAIWPLPGETGRTAGLAMQVTETTKFHRDTSAMTEALLISSVQQHENAEAAAKQNDLLKTEIGVHRRAEEQLRRAFEAVMTNMSEGLYTTDRQGRVTAMNPMAETLLGWRLAELRGRKMRDVTTHGQEDGGPCPAGKDAAFQAIETDEPLIDREDFFIRKDGSVFPVLFSAVPLREGGEDTVGLVVAFRDITERKRAEEHERALASELAHRNRNLLAVIQAIVARSLTNEHSAAEHREILMERLQALARSQKILESKGYEGASLAEIIRLELDAFASRYRAAGPDVVLNAKATQTFALLIHELATNATKHGALSGPDGSVGIDWAIDSTDAEPRFRFRWRERGGPPVVRPKRRGFGRVLIEKVAAQEFGGQPRVGYEPEGLSYEIEAPLPVVVAANPQEPHHASP